MAKGSTDTPLMLQHRSIKAKYPDAILLFRVGDFYETFGNDAVVASKILGITLTKRGAGSPSEIELAGFPYHSLDTYLHKLVKAGYRVAICDQLEDPKTVKGIVKRGVTELVTPGTATNDKLLENKTNNFLAALYINAEESGAAFIDISTGEFFVAEGNIEYIDKLLQSFRPSEVVFQKNKAAFFNEHFVEKYFTYLLDEWVFTKSYAEDILTNQFQVISLKGFGIIDLPSAIIAAGAAIHYLKETEKLNLQHLSAIQRITRDEFLWMDRFTIRNLELMDSNVENGNSLASVLDTTVSPMGSRLLKRWIIFPLLDKNKITERLDATAFFINEKEMAKQLESFIKATGDIERLVSKIPLKKISPREVLQLAKGLIEVDKIKTLASTADNILLQRIVEQLNPCLSICNTIQHTIMEDAPALANKGNLVKMGINAELDELRTISKGGKNFLLDIQLREAERTGIPSLKLSFNNVYGYYLEVTHTHKNKVPEDWIRKQTLTTAERYITPELKVYEEKILGAEEKIISLEIKIFDELLMQLQEYIAPMQLNGNLLGQMDVLLCFATIALKNKYTRPIVTDSSVLQIKEGRHPVIEQNLPVGEEYIANDVMLDKEQQQIIIITGPNMSGKSALLRQTALIVLMAHIGSFVSASHAEIGLTDKIFTRVGASDNLSGGESTFMVEMNETASIINNISERSLIILDEIGRGTSTFDGISIAWSIAEYLHQHIGMPKTLFATHYHELNELENKMDRIKNYHITHKEVGNKVFFLRKLVKGGSKHSFGIHVAKMAGMPNSLVDRANEILAMLEEKNVDEKLKGKMQKIDTAHFQLNIFDGLADDLKQIKHILEGVEINMLTPVEALMKLNELKGIVSS
ncbi:MAG: DNA mismatch repair protein MutS [Chitinophagaceae bacterium]|nr:DNA mismatch repair protein MutS [Chitinophagaceae bacterium]